MLIYNSVSVSLAITQTNSSTLDLISHEMEKLCYRKFRILNRQHAVILVAESHCKSFLQYLVFALRANDHTSVFFTGCPKGHLRFPVQCGMNVLQEMLSQAARAGAAHPEVHKHHMHQHVSRAKMPLQASLHVDVQVHFVTF